MMKLKENNLNMKKKKKSKKQIQMQFFKGKNRIFPVIFI